MNYSPKNNVSHKHYKNKRMDKKYELESEITAAWTNSAFKATKTNVSIPGEDAASNAKDWVDNGSRL